MQLGMYTVDEEQARRTHFRTHEGWVYAYQLHHDCSPQQAVRDILLTSHAG